MANPQNIHPNDKRRFKVGERYWYRESDDYVMPYSNSPFEQPDGFLLTVAIDEESLEADHTPLEKLPEAIDVTNPFGGRTPTFDAGHSAPQRRPMPVTIPRAQDDHLTRERTEQMEAELEQQARGRRPSLKDAAAFAD